MLSVGVLVGPLEHKLDELDAPEISAEWYRAAGRVLRGGDGGEHGLLLYKLIMEGARGDGTLVVLDVGTARGFSAIDDGAGDAGWGAGGACLLDRRSRSP